MVLHERPRWHGAPGLAPAAAIVAEKLTFETSAGVEVDTVRVEADAAAAKQTCALVEKQFTNLSDEVDCYQAKTAELSTASERCAADLTSPKAEIHRLGIQSEFY
ncbi:hypothetical protein QYE76_052463 [Lolium multiflorum]|uniref:Uncharacterized protein n=1 Tax=Lolium multiflorum TaxID=4521 RepID=A0AAD8SV24_LOLMU|nr:hypothetical protein QYE76_052463 [Lolium multiflorum]